MKATGVAVRWTRTLNKKWTALFVFHRGPDSELKLFPGDEMRLKLPSFATQFGLDHLVADHTYGQQPLRDFKGAEEQGAQDGGSMGGQQQQGGEEGNGLGMPGMGDMPEF